MSRHAQQFEPQAPQTHLQQSPQGRSPKLTTLQQLSQQYRRLIWLFVAVIFCSFLTSFHWEAKGNDNGTLPVGIIRVRKVTQPPTTNVNFNFVLTGNNINLTLNARHNQNKSFGELAAPNDYQLVETMPTGWVQASATCSDGSPVTAISLGDNESILCTFTNVQLGKLIIQKITEPSNNSTTSFPFTTGGGLSPTNFALRGGESKTLDNILPGSGYSINEVLPTGWLQRTARCSNDSPLNNITIAPGETVTCTVINRQLGKLIVRKSTTPDPDRTNADFSFSTGGGLTPDTFTLKSGQRREFDNLPPGSGYSVSEGPLANWQNTAAICDNGSALNNIRVEAGQTVTCTFHNTATLVNLTLNKDDGNFTAEPGDTIVYRLNYRNTGNKNAEAVVITEQVPAHTTFAGPADQWSCAFGAPAGTSCTATIGTLVGGSAQGEITFRVTVNSTLPAGTTQIENVARIGYSGNATAAESSDTTPLEANVGLKLSKDDGGGSAGAGEIIAYTLAYNNEGTLAALGVVISETVPAYTTFAGPAAQWSCPVSSPAGSSCQHTVGLLLGKAAGTVPFQVKVVESLPAELTQISNRAVIGAQFSPNADDGSDRTEIRATPDLTLGVSDNNATVAPGASVGYRLSYTNLSTRSAAGVQLTVALPAFTHFSATGSSIGWQCSATTCTYPVGNLPSGGGNTIDFMLIVDRPLPAGTTTLPLSARIADDGQNGVDPTPQNNLANDTTPIVAPLALSATKRDSLVIDGNRDGQAGAGDTIEYVIVLRNDGGLGLRQLVLTDEIDPNLQLLAGVTTSQGTITTGNSAAEQQVEVNVGDLAGAGGSATISFRAMVDKPLAALVSSVQNQATIRSPDFADQRTDDPDTTTVNDATQTPLNAVVQLRNDLNDFLFIDADNNVAVSLGDTLIYELTLQNVGEVNSGPFAVNLPLDPNVRLIAGSVSSSRGTVTSGTNADEEVQVNIDDLAASDKVLITFQVRIVTATNAVISHQANLTSDSVNGLTGLLSDDPDTASTSDATLTPLGSKPPLRAAYLPLINR